eukprot:COSAG02_NODE_35158_length_472_cov_103.742627_1_plen_90_part_10
MSQCVDNLPLGDTCSDEDHDHVSQQELQLSQGQSHCEMGKADELCDDGAAAETKEPATQPSLPINSSRIPNVGDRVEVEYNEAPGGAPNP